MRDRIYLDYNATTPLAAEVAEAMERRKNHERNQSRAECIGQQQVADPVERRRARTGRRRHHRQHLSEYSAYQRQGLMLIPFPGSNPPKPIK